MKSSETEPMIAESLAATTVHPCPPHPDLFCRRLPCTAMPSMRLTRCYPSQPDPLNFSRPRLRTTVSKGSEAVAAAGAGLQQHALAGPATRRDARLPYRLFESLYFRSQSCPPSGELRMLRKIPKFRHFPPPHHTLTVLRVARRLQRAGAGERPYGDLDLTQKCSKSIRFTCAAFSPEKIMLRRAVISIPSLIPVLSRAQSTPQIHNLLPFWGKLNPSL